MVVVVQVCTHSALPDSEYSGPVPVSDCGSVEWALLVTARQV